MKPKPPTRRLELTRVDTDLFRRAMDEHALQIEDGLVEIAMVLGEAIGYPKLTAALRTRINTSVPARTEATSRLLAAAFEAVSRRV
jgi:hypothetical protein